MIPRGWGAPPLYISFFYHTQEKQLTDLPISQTSMKSSLSQEPCLLRSYNILHGALRYLSNEWMSTSPIYCEHLPHQQERTCFINSEVLHRCRGWLICCKVFIEHQACFTVVMYFSGGLQRLRWYIVLGLITVIVLISIDATKWLR